ncbi:L-threonylcarbamoyladenylate synthase [Rickettsiella endosymbiont of Miltochrista miniata]|uniref:L-threonylcarbamoyladenylate synthase n=1 Tax=Rickettsiella endosymbiont of Miltochrista miniata TaxID=3066239 RepID=UPI00313C843D
MITTDELSKAIKFLKEGKLIVFPTETVYALAGDARNFAAIQQIFALKQRPLNQPLSVLLGKEHALDRWARDIPAIAEKLAQHFWPGPLTLILHKEKSVLTALTGGQDKIGLRMPDHPIAQAILNSFGSGLAAPSANRSAHLSPTQIEHVREEFDNKLELIIDGGPCSIGIESTIIDVTFDIPRILRLGAISLEQLKSITPYEIEESTLSHRLSKKPLLKQVSKQELEYIIDDYLNQHKTLTVFGLSPIKKKYKNLTWICMPNDVSQYAQVLYKFLHEAQHQSSDEILVESVPKLKAWTGIQSILNKHSA